MAQITRLYTRLELDTRAKDWPSYLVFELETKALDLDESIANPPKKPRLMSCPSETTHIRFYGSSICCESFNMVLYGADLHQAKYVYEKGFLHDLRFLPECAPQHWVCKKDSNGALVGLDPNTDGVYFITDVGMTIVALENYHNGYYSHDFVITGVNGQSASGDL